MIISKLMGGLGNQMFQYAAAKALALHHHTNCKVDLSFLNTDPKGSYTKRKFELDCFDTTIEIVDENKGIINKIASFISKPNLVLEKGHQFRSDFFNLSPNSYLNGFWQSEKYFGSYQNEIKKDFTFKKSVVAGVDNLIEQVKTSNSVSLHIRRGDYVSLDSAKDFHGTCSNDYYKVALEYISEKEKDLTVFVFSDDIAWCKANLKTELKHFFVETDSAYKEMYLMQNCKHNIIANSSFSWWGAWLNSNTNKTVIAPKKWFNDQTINTSDIVPSDWIKL